VSDEIRFILASQEIKRNIRYDISMSIFTVPAAFSMDFGTRRSVAEIAYAFPPNTPFQVFCGENPLFTGFTDGFHLSCDKSGSRCNFIGRDVFGKLVKNEVPFDIHVAGKTYYDLFVYVLEQNGIVNPTILGSNVTNRQVQMNRDSSTTIITTTDSSGNLQQIVVPKAGVNSGKSFNPSPRGNASRYELKFDDTKTVLDLKPKTSVSEINGQAVAKTGQSWFEFLKSYFDKAGLFVWGGARGEYIISQPDITQSPSYRLLRLYSGGQNNVVSGELTVDYTNIHAFCNTYGRTGSARSGRLLLKANAFNEEAIALGYNDILSAKDGKVSNQRQAKALAHRKLAEERRKGIHAEYVVRGHKTTLIGGGAGVWVPDTCVELVDDEFELNGVWYISGVRYTRDSKGGTFTHLSLLRPQDCLFSGQLE
jgi:prophage tail gpP-like protein